MEALAAPTSQFCLHIKGIQRHHVPAIHRHTEHLLSLFLRGTGHYRIGPVTLPSDRPLLLFLPAGAEDENGFAGPVEAWTTELRWPGLRLAREREPVLEATIAGRALRLPRFKVIDAPLAARAVERFSALRAAMARQDAASELRVGSLLLELVAFYLEAPERGAGAERSHRALARFRAALDERACEPVTIERLASEAGLSADHLRELFQARYGSRPVEYRAQIRLARARELLASTTLGVAEVARRAGYDDPLYFSRVFRARFGMTPSELIRRFRLER
jgi:AraC-like DNA-binding protein